MTYTRNWEDLHNIAVVKSTLKSCPGTMVSYQLVSRDMIEGIKWHKEQCIDHMELLVDNMSQTFVNSVITQKIMDDQVQLDTLTTPLHNLSWGVTWSLDKLLESLRSQFLKDESSISMTDMWKVQIDTGNSVPVSQKPYPIAMKHNDWVKDEIIKLLDAKVIHSSHSSLSAPIIIIPEGDGGKCLVNDYRTLNKFTQKFVWPMPKV